MADWLTHVAHSLGDQAGAWFVGVVLALLGVFSGKLVETTKFALNRADLRTKYYEELASNISNLIFIIDRLTRVYYGSTWAGDEEKNVIAIAYNESMQSICRQEYVYLSWLNHYWSRRMAASFVSTMEKIRCVDAILIKLNAGGDSTVLLEELGEASRELRETAHILLADATR